MTGSPSFGAQLLRPSAGSPELLAGVPADRSESSSNHQARIGRSTSLRAWAELLLDRSLRTLPAPTRCETSYRQHLSPSTTSQQKPAACPQLDLLDQIQQDLVSRERQPEVTLSSIGSLGKLRHACILALVVGSPICSLRDFRCMLEILAGYFMHASGEVQMAVSRAGC